VEFLFSEDQSMIAEAARDFARDALAPGAEERDENRSFPLEEIKQAGELGLLAINLPEELGGAGLDTLSLALVIKEISKEDPASGAVLATMNGCFNEALLKFGSDEMKESLLSRAATGEILTCHASTEEVGPDPDIPLVTTYRVEGDQYVLVGEKSFVSNARCADYALVLACDVNSNSDPVLTYFVVDMKADGVSISREWETLGQTASDVCSIRFEDVRLKADAIVGEEGKGGEVFEHIMDYWRILIAAQGWGITEKMYEAGAQYAGERVQFGRQIGKFQAIQGMIADNYADAMICQSVAVNAAMRRDSGLDCHVQGCAAKLICSEAAFRTADRSTQIFGGYGFSREYPTQRYYRDAKGLGIYGKTSEQIRVSLGMTGLKEKKF